MELAGWTVATVEDCRNWGWERTTGWSRTHARHDAWLQIWSVPIALSIVINRPCWQQQSLRKSCSRLRFGSLFIIYVYIYIIIYTHLFFNFLSDQLWKEARSDEMLWKKAEETTSRWACISQSRTQTFLFPHQQRPEVRWVVWKSTFSTILLCIHHPTLFSRDSFHYFARCCWCSDCLQPGFSRDSLCGGVRPFERSLCSTHPLGHGFDFQFQCACFLLSCWLVCFPSWNWVYPLTCREDER